MNEEIKAFWREADLSISSPLARISKMLGVLGALICAALGVYVLGKQALSDAPAAILAVAVSLIGALATLSVEMYHKGGKAGHALKERADGFRSLAENDAARIRVSKVLTQTKDDLSLIAEWARGARPMSGRADEMQKLSADFLALFKKKVRESIADCDRQTSAIPEATLGTDVLESLDDYHNIGHFMRRKANMIDTLLRSLSGHPSPSQP
jgi:hypothetical protein